MAVVAIPTNSNQPTKKATTRRRVLRRKRQKGYLLPLVLVLPIILCLFGVTSCFRASRAGAVPPGKTRAKPLSNITLIIDPGHGGVDTGAGRGGWCEAALTYRTASNIITQLQAEGATVYSTMKSNALLELPPGKPEPKIDIPKDACLLLTGKHIEPRRNDDASDLWKRAEIAQVVWNRSSPEQQKHMRVVVDPRCPLSNLAIVLAKKMDRAKLFGPQKRPTQIIKRELGVLNPLYNPLKQKALLEMGTISNPQDRKNATDPKWRNKVASMIVEAVKETDRVNASEK
jgi:N-acetylmuramoyl-L-alanine amidase